MWLRLLLLIDRGVGDFLGLVFLVRPRHGPWPREPWYIILNFCHSAQWLQWLGGSVASEVTEASLRVSTLDWSTFLF